MHWWSKVLEGVKKHCSDLDENECGKEKEVEGDLVGQESVFLDGVGWMGFAGTEVAGLDADQVYPGQGGEGVASVPSNGEDTYTLKGLMVHKNTRRGKVKIVIR